MYHYDDLSIGNFNCYKVANLIIIGKISIYPGMMLGIRYK
jgi:hypothetical protein